MTRSEKFFLAGVSVVFCVFSIGLISAMLWVFNKNTAKLQAEFERSLAAFNTQYSLWANEVAVRDYAMRYAEPRTNRSQDYHTVPLVFEKWSRAGDAQYRIVVGYQLRSHGNLLAVEPAFAIYFVSKGGLALRRGPDGAVHRQIGSEWVSAPADQVHGDRILNDVQQLIGY